VVKDWRKIPRQNIKLECGRRRGVNPTRQKTKVIRKLQKGLCSSTPKSSCALNITFKSKNEPLIKIIVKSQKASK
tara:strand:+ start:331 stop:555 length:225 start_codon:yes stop_codon:yes gene_type:complete